MHDASWHDAHDNLKGAQAEMLRWYRDVHEPAARSGDVCRVEDEYDARCSAIHEARLRLLTVPAPDWSGFLIKLQHHSWITAMGGSDEATAAAYLLASDVVRLAASSGETLLPLPVSPHVGPNLADLR